MIQRIQTIYLIIAIGLMVGFLFMPFGYEVLSDGATTQYVESALKAKEFVGLIISVALSLLAMVIAVFTYRKHTVQQAMVIAAALFIGACVGVVVYVLTAGMVDTNPEIATRTVWGGGGIFLIAAWIALWAAYRGIAADRKLLRSYDRLR